MPQNKNIFYKAVRINFELNEEKKSILFGVFPNAAGTRLLLGMAFALTF